MKQNQIYLLALVGIVSVSLLAGSVQVSAQITGETCPNPLRESSSCPVGQCLNTSNKCILANPAPGQLLGFTDFGQLLVRIIGVLLYFAGAVATLFLVIGGYQYVASRGNEEAMEKAKKTLTAAIIGIVIIVMAFAIIQIINTALTQPPGPAQTSQISGFMV